MIREQMRDLSVKTLTVVGVAHKPALVHHVASKDGILVRDIL